MRDLAARQFTQELEEQEPDQIVLAHKAKILTANDSALRAETFHDPIMAVLRDQAREIYLVDLTMEVRQGLVNGLAATIRWQNGAQQVNPEFRENDLDHVLELLVWANEIETEYPDLYREVCDGDPSNWLNFLSMLIVHDIGEIQVGDMCLSNPELRQKSGKLHKRKEVFAARLMMRKFLDHDVAERHLSNFSRFERKAKDDKLVMLGHAMDKGQASQNVAKNVIPFNLGRQDFNVASPWYNSQATTMQYVVALMNELQTREAREQLALFFDRKVLSHFNALDIDEIYQVKLAEDGLKFSGWNDGKMDGSYKAAQ